MFQSYPVVIITCVHYLGPPGPFSFSDSRDLLEVLEGLSWQRERGGVPRGSSPGSLSTKEVLREPRAGLPTKLAPPKGLWRITEKSALDNRSPAKVLDVTRSMIECQDSKCMSSTRTEFLLWGNGYIKNVLLSEENSILLLPECLEST